ncbi:hypothetical protein [Gilvimarinus chinensis]|uniref:hypothetical protein n=1 Tax=Gilvimarinus chinensis TaxID=396005 RepID=UPI00047701B8|nr:hypothetical protein [Gilvimarinus chinensis]
MTRVIINQQLTTIGEGNRIATLVEIGQSNSALFGARPTLQAATGVKQHIGLNRIDSLAPMPVTTACF